MHRRHAFTLVELLVVIAIIAVLLAVLLPNVTGDKSLGKLFHSLDAIPTCATQGCHARRLNPRKRKNKKLPWEVELDKEVRKYKRTRSQTPQMHPDELKRTMLTGIWDVIDCITQYPDGPQLYKDDIDALLKVEHSIRMKPDAAPQPAPKRRRLVTRPSRSAA